MADDYTEFDYEEYLNAVDDYLQKNYGVVSEFDWSDQIVYAQEAGDSPQECAEWFATQYKLVKSPQHTQKTS